MKEFKQFRRGWHFDKILFETGISKTVCGRKDLKQLLDEKTQIIFNSSYLCKVSSPMDTNLRNGRKSNNNQNYLSSYCLKDLFPPKVSSIVCIATVTASAELSSPFNLSYMILEETWTFISPSGNSKQSIPGMAKRFRYLLIHIFKLLGYIVERYYFFKTN